MEDNVGNDGSSQSDTKSLVDENEMDEAAQMSSQTEESEEACFKEKTLEQQWREVVKVLVSRKARWDDSEQGEGRLLEEYEKNALIHRDDRERTTPTFFHLLAKGLDADDFKKFPENTISKIINYLLNNQESNLEGSHLNKSEETPILRVAMDFNNTEFIESVIKCSGNIAGKFEELLAATDHDGMNCLHYAFKVQLQKAITHLSRDKMPNLDNTVDIILSFVQVAKPETIAWRDKHGNTPLHYALNYRNCQVNSRRYQQILQQLLEKSDVIFKKKAAFQFNSKNESPYLYYLRTREEWFKTKNIAGKTTHLPTEASNNKPPEPKNGVLPGDASMVPSASGQDEKKRLDTEGITGNVDGDQEQPRSQPSHELNSNSAHAVSTKALARSQTHNSTLAIDLSRGMAPNNEKPKRKKKELLVDEMAIKMGESVKVHYIRTRSGMEAKELLYGKVASDKNLYFDAFHLAGEPVEQVIDLIEKLSNAGGFEDTLSYVYLPLLGKIDKESGAASKSNNIISSSNEKGQRGAAPQENPELGCSCLVKVFDKLVSVNVRRILRLQVVDVGDQPHTDATIERAIKGQDSFYLSALRAQAINIDDWDWRKLDLSMDVISFAAPDAAHVNLYWSGNQTILRGWGRPEGVSRHARPEGKLRKVTLHAFPGHETHERTMKMIEVFKSEIKCQMESKNDEDKIEIKIKIRPGSATSIVKSDAGLNARDIGMSDSPPQQVWIENMENFRSALFPIHRLIGKDTTIPRVRVALIDDGVDLLNLDMYNNTVQVTGISYYPPNGLIEQPWHQSTNGHGTVMANMIVRLNPWVSLDVMKIHDSIDYSSGSKTRTIYADSAAKAIEDAIIRKADIISMSWTIRKLVGFNANSDVGISEEHKRSPELVAMRKLHAAIEKAKSNSILMFCSAADDIKQLGRESLPFSAAPDCIFRIGAALSMGQRDPTSEDVKTISYFFPGNQVADARNPRSSKPVEYHDGSSVSTALAAGLASLIIHCANVVTMHDNDQKLTNVASQLRKHRNMCIAFDNINEKEYADKKFLHVWRMFGDATTRINIVKGKDEKISKLKDLVTALCHKLED